MIPRISVSGDTYLGRQNWAADFPPALMSSILSRGRDELLCKVLRLTLYLHHSFALLGALIENVVE
jgi:hypothetical protein